MTQAPTKDQEAVIQAEAKKEQEKANKEAEYQAPIEQKEAIEEQKNEAAQESGVAGVGALPIIGAGSLFKKGDTRTLEEVAAQVGTKGHGYEKFYARVNDGLLGGYDKEQKQIDKSTSRKVVEKEANKTVKASAEKDWEATKKAALAKIEKDKEDYRLANPGQELQVSSPYDEKTNPNYEQYRERHINKYVKDNLDAHKKAYITVRQGRLQNLVDERFGKFVINPDGTVTLTGDSYEDQAREAVFKMGVLRGKYLRRENAPLGLFGIGLANKNKNIIALHNRIEAELHERFAASLSPEDRAAYLKLYKKRAACIKATKHVAGCDANFKRQRQKFLKRRGLESSYNQFKQNSVRHQLEILRQRSPRLYNNWFVRQHLRVTYKDDFHGSMKNVFHKRTYGIAGRGFRWARPKMSGAFSFIGKGISSGSTGFVTRINSMASGLKGFGSKLKPKLSSLFKNLASKGKFGPWSVGLITIVIVVIVYFVVASAFPQGVRQAKPNQQGSGYCDPKNLQASSQHPDYFPDSNSASIASCICQHESGSNPTIGNLSCTTPAGGPDYSIGLFQINLISHCDGALQYDSSTKFCSMQNASILNTCEYGSSPDDTDPSHNLFNPDNNIRAAVLLYKQHPDWSDWNADSNAVLGENNGCF